MKNESFSIGLLRVSSSNSPCKSFGHRDTFYKNPRDSGFSYVFHNIRTSQTKVIQTCALWQWMSVVTLHWNNRLKSYFHPFTRTLTFTHYSRDFLRISSVQTLIASEKRVCCWLQLFYHNILWLYTENRKTAYRVQAWSDSPPVYSLVTNTAAVGYRQRFRSASRYQLIVPALSVIRRCRSIGLEQPALLSPGPDSQIRQLQKGLKTCWSRPYSRALDALALCDTTNSCALLAKTVFENSTWSVELSSRCLHSQTMSMRRTKLSMRCACVLVLRDGAVGLLMHSAWPDPVTIPHQSSVATQLLSTVHRSIVAVSCN